MQAVKPPPASMSPPLITASALLSTSHLSSLHHWKGVKISHHKTSLPTYPPTPLPTNTFIPSLNSHPHSFILPHYPLPPLTSAFLAPTLLSHSFFFFCLYLSIYLPLQNSHLAIFFPLYYAVGFTL